MTAGATTPHTFLRNGMQLLPLKRREGGRRRTIFSLSLCLCTFLKTLLCRPVVGEKRAMGRGDRESSRFHDDGNLKVFLDLLAVTLASRSDFVQISFVK